VGERDRAAEPDDLVQDRREPLASGRQLDAAARVGARGLVERIEHVVG
jgi:hypothetical protein